MTKHLSKRERAQVWTLLGYSLAVMSIFIPSEDVWRKTVLSLAVMMLAAALGAVVRARRVHACPASPRDE